VSIREDIERAIAEERRRFGALEPWWVMFDNGPAEALWCSTPEGGDGYDVLAVARTLYYNRIRFVTVTSTDPALVRLDLRDVREHLAVAESDMGRVMAAVRRSGLHGHYRKAGTDREYAF